MSEQAEWHYTFYEHRECKNETNGKMWFYWGF
jgi:hypothetical protein